MTSRKSRCAICGVPVFWLRLQKIWMHGGERGNRHLTVDHIIPNGPSTAVNTRILCYSCNRVRGHAEYTDAEVLVQVRRWYVRMFGPRFLWWLNTTPGEGGTLNRNKYTEARDRRLHGEAPDVG